MDNDIKSDAELFLFIPAKYELWPKNFFSDDETSNKFDEEIYGLMAQVKISVAQSVMLYHFLGDDNALYQFKDNADNKKNAVAGDNAGGNINAKNMANDESDDEDNKNKKAGKKVKNKKKKNNVRDDY